VNSENVQQFVVRQNYTARNRQYKAREQKKIDGTRSEPSNAGRVVELLTMAHNGTKQASAGMTRLKIFDIRKWIDAFRRDAQVRGLSQFTIEYYRAQLAIFEPFAKSHDVIEVTDITRTYCAPGCCRWKQTDTTRAAGMQNIEPSAPGCTGLNVRQNRTAGKIPC